MNRKILVRFATNRARVEGPDMFGPNFADASDPGRYVTGSVEVVRYSGLPDTGWWPDAGTLHLDAGPAVAAAAAPSAGILEFCKSVTQAEGFRPLRGAPFGIVLLHGFAASFADSMSRAAQLCDNYGGKEVFVFSWPSRGKVTPADYREDQRSAERSSAAVADALTTLLAFLQGRPDRPRLQLVAHSMGTRALRFALQAIRQRHPDLLKDEVFEHALLMASDEDDDGLSDEARLGPLVRLADRVEVYYCWRDQALAISQVLNGPRLGLSGPRNMASLPERITAIDATAVSWTTDDNGETHFRHQYYRLSPRVIADVVHVLAGLAPGDIPGRLPDDRETQSGRSYVLPFDEEAGRARLVAEMARVTVTDA